MAEEGRTRSRLAIATITLAVLLGVAAFATFSKLKHAPDLLGAPRSLAIGAPIAVVALSFFVSGGLLVVTRSTLGIVAAMFSALAFGASFVAFWAFVGRELSRLRAGIL